MWTGRNETANADDETDDQAERLKLVVNNRRFTILSEPGERRNLASECLGLVARELPRLWLKKFRYRPLLAETFCDIERTAGTCTPHGDAHT